MAASYIDPFATKPKVAGSSFLATIKQPTTSPFAPKPAPSPLQAPGQNMKNPGLGEQAINVTQNRLLEDPSQGLLSQAQKNTQTQSAGEQNINQNLGTLQGPGQGDQYWSQVSGQFNDPFAGEQFTRQATQNFGASGPASAFYNQSMGQYGDFTGFSGPQNSQGQYGASAASLSGGTQGENGLSQIAGGYDSMGKYGDPNLAAGQYAQTQGAFGAMPIANFDPFYDRARQLATQDYNRQSAGRGVYGSSEALSGVGNVITDIEAQRANRSFDAEMQRTQEQRARQQLLGEQARMGDLSSLAAFGANLSGAETFGNINNQLASREIDRNQLLGNLANNADSQALGAQNANISGLNAFANISQNADSAETNRYTATTTAQNNADRTAIDRLQTGANIADTVDDNNRQDYDSGVRAAESGARIGLDRNQQGANIAQNMSQNDLNRLTEFNNASQGAENQRQSRVQSQINATFKNNEQIQNVLGNASASAAKYDADAFEDYYKAEIAPLLQAGSYDQQQQAAILSFARQMFDDAHELNDDLS